MSKSNIITAFVKKESVSGLTAGRVYGHKPKFVFSESKQPGFVSVKISGLSADKTTADRIMVISEATDYDREAFTRDNAHRRELASRLLSLESRIQRDQASYATVQSRYNEIASRMAAFESSEKSQKEKGVTANKKEMTADEFYEKYILDADLYDSVLQKFGNESVPAEQIANWIFDKAKEKSDDVSNLDEIKDEVYESIMAGLV